MKFVVIDVCVCIDRGGGSLNASLVNLMLF